MPFVSKSEWLRRNPSTRKPVCPL